ncbi:hypothetical protein DACRYDRAFT_19886 [Dacryopinax primogenitus]|uniref:Uncharacterized protein n=1 Tax=Dacryopinax primogenitus (strain DJM 731) TaxID=1858805 RepID=M5G9A0_DACPD|nr:uncharacterized protein DACRYDRAFT_19886 [Dacryopinax primogenitus]EJU05354.1 hypothetical protein DACRYDRAFT_19886 [Dacryopinax primogenitus]
MSQSTLATFDPFKTHPFTRAGSTPTSTASGPSNPTQPVLIAAPQPRRTPMPSPPSVEPVFTRFELERKTPDLVLKKLGGNWGNKGVPPNK